MGQECALVQRCEMPAAKSAAWLRPCFSDKIPRDSNIHSNVLGRQGCALYQLVFKGLT